ncbi:hypothetical protein F0M03_12030 [Vibrio parahaemolyticus]|nr:hypothetical protein [Vibrio parahaemolyticus]EHR0228192.1 hypothetical protein [Vibrio parahaemolyticus]MRE03851.1 hypothetical protein [Vibrio parahaemolyticus]RXP62018.1 hypothetical protein EGL73_00440 [Vibrio parahaemolyticus]RXP63739.1 hypothetical protein EGL72_00425 [Vibrio parahaemolyticus]RXP73877.1 hypothetical protein EGL71_00440 [Vibrio parahaemolyticus]
MNSFNTGMSLPRFLKFIDLAYLVEGTRLTNEQFDRLILEASDDDRKKNINATRQNIMRSIFISSFSILEQNLDEIVQMRSKSAPVDLTPNDLKDRGIRRSITYAKKVLNMTLDTSQSHWRIVFQLQDLRNHLVHYGSTFSDSLEHEEKLRKFHKIPHVSMTDSINFTYKDIENISRIFHKCIRDFNKPKRKNT